MKLHLRFFALFLLLLLFGFSAVQAQEYVAVIIKARGQVNLTKPNSTRRISAQKGHILRSGDKIETGSGSFCAIKFLDDKSLLRIKENSSCVVEGEKSEGKIDKNIIVEVGSFFASLFKPRGSFKITTPTSVASVKGTKWWTVQRLDGVTLYINLEGLIDILNDAGRVLLRPGQTALVSSQTKLPEIRLTNSDEIPSDDEGGSGLKSMEIEFQDQNGQTKRLRLDYQEQ